MTPPASSAAAPRALPHRPPARRTSSPSRGAHGTGNAVAPRRVAGPLRGRQALAGAGLAATSIAAPLGSRAARGLIALPDWAFVDRLVRGRAWIGVVGFLLIGIVFMQVSLLQMNAGIGSAVERSAGLDRANGELRAQVSRLSAGERIQGAASQLGMLMPSAGAIQYSRSVIARDATAAGAALSNGDFAPGTTPAALPSLDPSEQMPPAPDQAATTQNYSAPVANTGG